MALRGAATTTAAMLLSLSLGCSDKSTSSEAKPSEPSHRPRHNHATAALSGGRVFFAGGSRQGDSPADVVPVLECEIFDPATASWADAGVLVQGHTSGTATAVGDKVLVTGGISQGQQTNFTELCGADGGPCEGAGSMRAPRENHAAVALDDHRVLVVGGYVKGIALNGVEVFDANAKTWTEVAPLETPRSAHTVTRLQDGRVLVAGGREAGEGSNAIASTEILDPSTMQWSPGPRLHVARAHHTATLLTDGRVLVAGGSVELGRVTMTVEIFDPKTTRWAMTSAMTNRRRLHDAVLMPDGSVVVAGGDATGAMTGYEGVAPLERWDPKTGEWTSPASFAKPRTGEKLALLPGAVLAYGGMIDGAIVAEPETVRIDLPAPLPAP